MIISQLGITPDEYNIKKHNFSACHTYKEKLQFCDSEQLFIGNGMEIASLGKWPCKLSKIKSYILAFPHASSNVIFGVEHRKLLYGIDPPNSVFISLH